MTSHATIVDANSRIDPSTNGALLVFCDERVHGENCYVWNRELPPNAVMVERTNRGESIGSARICRRLSTRRIPQVD